MLYPFELEVEATLRSDLHVAGCGAYSRAD
jgi:hypothetical protein